MTDWIIMSIVFAFILVFAVYLIRRNRKERSLEKKGFWGWILETISHWH